MRTRSLLSVALLALCAATSNSGSQSAPMPTTQPVSSAAGKPPAQAPAPDLVELPARNLQDLLNQYSDLYASNRPADQLKLARILYKASNNAENTTQQFAMIIASRDAAARGGDYDDAWKVCDVAVEKFNVSPSEMRVGLFKAGTSSAAHHPESYFTGLTKAIDQALLGDQFEPARQMIQLGKSMPSSNAKWDSTLDTRQARLEAQSKSYAAIKPAFDSLQRLPADPQANLAVGQYTCFMKNDWQTGLPMLARGSDAQLRSLAVMDLREPTETARQLEVANGWNTIAGNHPDIAPAARLRAYDWYMRALPLATIDEQRTNTEEQLTALIPLVSSDRPYGAMWLAIGDCLSHRTFAPSRIAGGTEATDDANQTSQDLPAGGAMLVGFHYALARLAGRDVITYLQPIYLTPTGETEGATYGHAYSTVQTWHAPQGYAVGAIRAFGGATLNSINITAMRIDNDRLNPDDVRNSPRIGGPGGVLEILDGRGTPVIGVCGRQRDGFIGLGLMYSQPVKED